MRFDADSFGGPGFVTRARLRGPCKRSRLIVGRIVANDGIDDIDARLVGIGLPVVHPLALGPRIRAKEDDLLIAEGLLDLVPHRLELVILKLLGTHGGAAEGNGVIAGGLVCGEVGAGDDLCLGAGTGCALGNEVCHGLGVACTAPVDYCDLAHMFSFRLRGVRPRFVCSIGLPGQVVPGCSPVDRCR